jgi:HK97 gp10 family phage protein
MRFLIKDNIKEVVGQFNDQADVIKKQTAVEMWRAMSILEAAIKQNIRVRSGLKVRTGTLLNSIQKHVVEKGDTVTGTIGPENVPYAAIHEFGGTIPARRIEPRNAKALRWMGSGGDFFFSKGHDIPSFQIRARPFLQPAMDEKAEVIRQRFALFIGKAMEKN